MPIVENKVKFGRTATVTKLVCGSFALAKTSNGLQVMVLYGERYGVAVRNDKKCLDHFAQSQNLPCDTGIEIGTVIVFSKLSHCGEDDWEVGRWIPMGEFLQHAEVGDELLYITRD